MRYLAALFVLFFLAQFVCPLVDWDIFSGGSNLDLNEQSALEPIFDISDHSNDGLSAVVENAPCPVEGSWTSNKVRARDCRPQRTTDNKRPTNQENPFSNELPENFVIPGFVPAPPLNRDLVECPTHVIHGPRKAICDSGKASERILDEAGYGTILLNCNLCMCNQVECLGILLMAETIDNPLLVCTGYIWCCSEWDEAYRKVGGLFTNITSHLMILT